MEKQLNKLQALFKGAKPTVPVFEAHLKTLSDKKRKQQLYELCQLAFGYYRELPGEYRRFVDRYLKHDRHCYVDYLLEHTPLKHLRYTLRHPDLFIRQLHLLETSGHSGRTSYHHLAASLLVVFDYSYTLNTLGDYLRRFHPDPETILYLVGKLKIADDVY